MTLSLSLNTLPLGCLVISILLSIPLSQHAPQQPPVWICPLGYTHVISNHPLDTWMSHSHSQLLIHPSLPSFVLLKPVPHHQPIPFSPRIAPSCTEMLKPDTGSHQHVPNHCHNPPITKSHRFSLLKISSNYTLLFISLLPF